MGLGDMSRRLGMNQGSAASRKTLNEAVSDGSSSWERGEDEAVRGAMEAGAAEKRPEKRERIEAPVSDLTAEIRQLVADFADVEAQLAVLNARRSELKVKATKMSLEHGVDDFVGPQGKVQVIVKKASVSFDKKKAKQYLTEDQYKSCLKTGKVPDPTVKFVSSDK